MATKAPTSLQKKDHNCRDRRSYSISLRGKRKLQNDEPVTMGINPVYFEEQFERILTVSGPFFSSFLQSIAFRRRSKNIDGEGRLPKACGNEEMQNQTFVDETLLQCTQPLSLMFFAFLLSFFNFHAGKCQVQSQARTLQK